MKRSSGLLKTLLWLYAGIFASATAQAQGAQHLAFAGLRAVVGQGQFNSVKIDAEGNLYLLLDEKDGVRVLKTDASANQVLAETHLGARGDIGIALTLDRMGNVYVAGTASSGTLPTTSDAPFPSLADASINSFVAKLDSNLHITFLTYLGSGRMAVTGIAATADRVFLTGSIFAATLPTTPSAIFTLPADGSNGGNGFVESFNAAGTSLVYATYLTGFNGTTSATAIVADDNDDAYVAGYTTSPGYPTTAAVVPEMIGSGSGFLTKLTPAGDGIVFSTFLPGQGLTSLALDRDSQTLVLSGAISPGAFPIMTASAPIVTSEYQSVVRMPLDGSRVMASSLLAPGSQSVLAAGPDEAIWAAMTMSTPLPPLAPVAAFGNTGVFRIHAQNFIDESARIGSLGMGFGSTPVTIAAIALDSSGQPVLAGQAQPTTSADLLATQSFDLPLLNSPTEALPSSLRDAVLPAGTNCGSLCAGSGAYLAKLKLSPGPALAISTDAAPNLILRNLGSKAANNLEVSATGFTLSHDCPSQLAAGGECDLVLTGGWPGAVSISAANASSQSVSLAAPRRAASTVVYSPRELDFGVLVAGEAPVARTITVTNLGSSPVAELPSITFGTNALWTATVAGDCPGVGSAAPLQPEASCHLVISVSAPAAALKGSFQSTWSAAEDSPASSITITGFIEPTALNLSASEIAFGTQLLGGLRLPRFLYLSNNSATAIGHASVALGAGSPFTVADRCPIVIEPHTICQIEIDYLSNAVSSDSVTLSLDQGASVLVTGKTSAPSGTGGSTVNPNLEVTPSQLAFVNAVTVTSVSLDTQTVTVRNTGAAPLPVSLALTGDFAQSTSCGSTLAAGASCSVVVSFTPSAPGARPGSLAVTSGGSAPVFVDLSGTGAPLMAGNNGTLDLGSTAIGQPVVLWTKITQAFSQLTASAGGDFGVALVEDIGYGHGQPAVSEFTPTTTGSCFNCWLGVQLVPSAAGPRPATLKLASSAGGLPYVLSLTGNGLPLIGLLLTPLQQEFGPIAVHSSSAPTIFTLTNLTGGTVNLSAPSVTGGFAITNTVTGGPACVGTFVANASCFVTVAFSPTATGPASGTLTVGSSGNTAAAQLTGFGSPDPGLALNPEALVFRNVPSPLASRQTITLSNTGIDNLTIDTPTVNTASFAASTTCALLAPGVSCTITVDFIPTNATVTGTLSIPVTSSAPGNLQNIYTIALTGSYTDEDTGLQILPGEADYGPTPTSSLGVIRQFLINNLTTKSVTLALALPRQFVLTEPPCATLAPGAGCSFSVAFLPLTNGAATGTTAAQATPTDGSAAFSGLGFLEGFGQGKGSLSVTGDILPGEVVDFRQVASGQFATRTLTVINTGTLAITTRRITSEWPFLSTTTCGSALPVGGSCTVTVTYSPVNGSSSSSSPFNTDSGTLVIESNAESSPDFLNLTGTVTSVIVAAPSNSAPLVSLATSQGSLTFDPTQGGNVSAPQTLTLTNTGMATIHIERLTTTSDFAVSGSCATLVAGASCPLTVTFTPQASSSVTTSPVISALEISSDSSTSLEFVSLLGTATPSGLSLSTTALDFGAVLVGGSATLPIRIANGSQAAATIQSIQATGDYALSGDCPAAGSQLAASAGCTLQVTFRPSQAGVRTGTVSIATSLTTLALTANLTGRGTQSRLQISPSSLSFGDTALGKSASLTVTLTNNGTSAIDGIALAVTGDYVLTQPCPSTALAPGAACTAIVTFLPTAAGARTGSLTVSSSDPGSPVHLALTGNGIAAPDNGGGGEDGGGGGGTTPEDFTLTVDGGSTASLTVKSGQPASYQLALTPQEGFTGPVVLNCTSIHAGQYATCSLLPSSVSINGGAQSSAATLNTVTETGISEEIHRRHGPAIFAACLLPFGMLFLRRRAGLMIAFLSIITIFADGCGGGTIVLKRSVDDSSLLYTPPGTYQYQVTATNSSGKTIAKTVTLNLTVIAR